MAERILLLPTVLSVCVMKGGASLTISESELDGDVVRQQIRWSTCGARLTKLVYVIGVLIPSGKKRMTRVSYGIQIALVDF